MGHSREPGDVQARGWRTWGCAILDIYKLVKINDSEGT